MRNMIFFKKTQNKTVFNGTLPHVKASLASSLATDKPPSFSGTGEQRKKKWGISQEST